MKRSIFLLILIILTILISPRVFAEPSAQTLIDQLVQSSPGHIKISHHIGTGKVRFLSSEPGQSIPNVPGINANSTPSDAAEGFLRVYGPMFGISDPMQDLTVRRQKKADRGRSFLRYQQIYQNIPVFGGELIVQMNNMKHVISVHGKVSPDVTIDTTPKIDEAAATNAAVNLVAQQYNIEPSNLNASIPELWIYNPVLLDHELNKNFLVWRVEVMSDGLSGIDELVLVDANSGLIALHFNQIPHAKNRTIYDNQNLVSQIDVLPGLGPVRTEGQGAYGITDVDNAYNYTGLTYDFYWAFNGRDSLDNQGMTLITTVRHCSANYNPSCPMQNAFWNNTQMVFGDGFTSALDVVGHELTHGVTQYESSLFYYMQSGAINESLSDVWGELIQQTYEPPATPDRWLLGENLAAGAIRSMSNPPNYSDPDRMTSSFYVCGVSDSGGVHTNSGVNNKAAYLMVDGGSFNGKTVTGIGMVKTIKIYYEAQSNLLISSSDYADLYDVLQLACSDLIGTVGITVADCQQVKNAVDAVEMNLQPTNCSMCPAGEMPVDLFFDNFDAGLGNWTHSYTVGGDAWSLQLWGGSDYLIWGNDLPYASASYMLMNNSLTLPSNSYMQFDHFFLFEGNSNYDGGMVAYSTNGGGSWTNANTLFSLNGYNGSIYAFGSNPYAGYAAFVGSSGWHTSRLDLSPLTGQNTAFGFWIGTDSFNIAGSWLGWIIDNVRIYQCNTSVPTTVTTSPPGQQMSVDGITFISPQTFTWPRGTSHTISVASPQAGTTGTRYVFFSWSDGGGQTHSITTPASNATYTANFTTQYLLTTSVNLPGSGSITPNCSSGCWYNSGASINLSPTPAGGNTFLSWTGDISSLDSPLLFDMNGPKNITANFDSTAVSGTVRIVGTPPSYYSTVSLAYAAAVNNDVIQMQATSYDESLTFDRTDIPGLTVTLKGGYNSTYSDNTGVTTIDSPLTIESGEITLDRIVIQ